MSPSSNSKYTLKFCFPAENYGNGEVHNQGGNKFGSTYDKSLSKSISSSSSSSFIENETINKGPSSKQAFNNFGTSKSLNLEPLVLFSSSTHVLVRFYSSDGRFPSKGFRAKYKTGKLQILHFLSTKFESVY